MKYPKKLIEVALPLDDINDASAREKSMRHGHPSTLHLWWARRPLAAARAVIFAQMVNDPGGERGWGAYPGQTKADAQRERDLLFDIIRDLVKWENTNNEAVLERARSEIRKSWAETCKLTGEDPNKLPAFYDPFAGGGAIPLEAQRLGLESYASDLNPVPVLINKAMIEIPPKFAGRKPVGPIPESENQAKLHEEWTGVSGLAEDVRRYGIWMRDEAFKRIGHLYPQVEITSEMAKDRPDLKPLTGQNLTVIAWLWARTVKSPNPAYSKVDVPLASTFLLSTKPGKWERAITYSAEIGLIFKDTLSISPRGVAWKDRFYPLDAVTRVRWGGVRHSTNGIYTGTTYTIAFGDNRTESVVETKREDIYDTFTDKLWRGVCINIISTMLQSLAAGRSLSFDRATVKDSGITLIKRKFIGADDEVFCSWDDIKVYCAAGEFCVKHKNDDKVYINLSYINTPNTHVLEQVIRMAFKKPELRKLSELLD